MAVVGLEETLYRVMEGVGTVEVCAIFYQPPADVACPTPFPFDVSISTRNGTAGNSTFRTSFSYRKWDRLSKATDVLEEIHGPNNLEFLSVSPAEPPMDYMSLSIMLRFEACSREVCTSVTIVDDLVDEPDESFFVILGETPDLDARITLAPTLAEIVIEDNDSELASHTHSAMQLSL